MMKRKPVYLSDTDGIEFLEKFKDAQAALMSILESSFDGIYITDGDANTILINSSYEVISGLTRDEVMGKNMRELEQTGVISRSASLLALQSREPVTIEQEFRTGRRTIVTSTPIFDSKNTIVMVVTNVRDVSELYILREELARNCEINQRYQSEIEIIRKQILGNVDLVAKDKKMIDLLRMVNRAAQLDTAVLLLGETGVGKECVAAHIHRNSRRCHEQFIKVNCAAISENLIESELFGYERGAFTDARKEGKMGLFEVADEGTLFLDEIGEVPCTIQVKLLRVLQEQEVRRIGADKPIRVNVRILAATNRNLEAMVADGTFREDLYYRLNVFPVTIPPLRERREDIPVLAQHMLDFFNKKYSKNKAFSQTALARLREYRWPGNVRELKNIVERAFIMSEETHISAADLPLDTPRTSQPGSTENGQPLDLKAILEKTEFEYLNQAYEQYHNVRAAARSLQMDPATYIRKRKKYQLKHMIQK